MCLCSKHRSQICQVDSQGTTCEQQHIAPCVAANKTSVDSILHWTDMPSELLNIEQANSGFWLVTPTDPFASQTFKMAAKHRRMALILYVTSNVIGSVRAVPGSCFVAVAPSLCDRSSDCGPCTQHPPELSSQHVSTHLREIDPGCVWMCDVWKSAAKKIKTTCLLECSGAIGWS